MRDWAWDTIFHWRVSVSHAGAARNIGSNRYKRGVSDVTAPFGGDDGAADGEDW